MSRTPSQTSPPPARIYILDDEVVTVQRLVQALSKDGHLVEGFITGREALLKVCDTPPDLIIMDIRLTDGDGIDLMQRMRAAAPEMAVILMTGYAAIDQAVEATKKGAFNYLEKPVKLQTIREAVADALVGNGEDPALRPALRRAMRTLVQRARDNPPPYRA